MSSDDTISEPRFSWTPSDAEVGDNAVVGSEVSSVDRTISVEDPSKVANVDVRGLIEQRVVRAVADVVEFPEYVDIAEASTSGRHLGVLNDSPASVVTNDHLHGLRVIYGIPESVELRAAQEHERADWDIPGWTCFYEYILRLGFRFPIPRLIRHVLKYYDIAPGQLMPNSWRILLSLTVLNEKYGYEFGIGSLLHNYYMKEHVNDQGRYMLIPRTKENQLITDTTTNDRNWKDTFFFAKGPPVDGPWERSKYVYRRVWTRQGIVVCSPLSFHFFFVEKFRY